MRRFVLCLGLLLAWPLATQAAKPAEPTSIEFGAGAWVDVDATGKAHVVEMDRLSQFKDEDKPESIADVIKARLRERIESWEFTPPTKNGVPVSGKTHVSVALTAEDDGAGGLQLKVKSAGTGMQMLQRPHLFPVLNKMGGYNGWWFNIHLNTDLSGRVVDVQMIDSKGFNGREFVNQPPRFTSEINKAALNFVKGITFTPEVVDGEPIAGEGEFPIKICASDSACDKASTDSGEQREGSDFAATDPAVKLRTAVAGTAL